jgi:hypothetical protein
MDVPTPLSVSSRLFSDMRRILIIAYYWPPLNAIGSHRPYWWAKVLSEAGHQVTVLTSRKYSFDGPCDLDLPVLPGVRLISVSYLGLRGALASALARTPFWSAAKLIYRRSRAAQRVLKDPRGQWRKACLPLIEELARSHDVIISTFSPAAAHELASELKACNPSLRWIADYRDHWSLAADQAISAEENLALADHERDIVGRRADHIVSVSDEFSVALSEFLELPATTIMNGHDRPEAEIRRAIAARAQPKPSRQRRIVYTGTIYPKKRDPRPLLSSLADLDLRLEDGQPAVVVEFYGREMGQILEFARDERFAPYVKAMGYRPRDTILRIQSEADALLLLEGNRASDKGVLTGKIFEYVASGVVILSLGSTTDSAIAEVLRRTQSGMCAGSSPKLIREFLEALASGSIEQSFTPQLDQIMTYHRETQARKLLDLLA